MKKQILRAERVPEKCLRTPFTLNPSKCNSSLTSPTTSRKRKRKVSCKTPANLTSPARKIPARGSRPSSTEKKVWPTSRNQATVNRRSAFLRLISRSINLKPPQQQKDKIRPNKWRSQSIQSSAQRHPWTTSAVQTLHPCSNPLPRTSFWSHHHQRTWMRNRITTRRFAQTFPTTNQSMSAPKDSSTVAFQLKVVSDGHLVLLLLLLF